MCLEGGGCLPIAAGPMPPMGEIAACPPMILSVAMYVTILSMSLRSKSAPVSFWPASIEDVVAAAFA